MPALVRLGRRCTVEELSELAMLSSTPLTFAENQAALPQLLGEIDGQLARSKSRITIANRAAAASDPGQDARVTVPPNAMLADALEEISRQTSNTWYVSGKNIVIVSKVQQVHSQLGKRLTKRYDGVDVSQVLLDLFQRAGVDFTIDAGAFQRIPAGYRTIRLQLDDATVQQALQTIGGYTGLSFDVTGEGVHVSMPVATAPTTSPN
jgi:hypothetical protein